MALAGALCVVTRERGLYTYYLGIFGDHVLYTRSRKWANACICKVNHPFHSDSISGGLLLSFRFSQVLVHRVRVAEKPKFGSEDKFALFVDEPLLRSTTLFPKNSMAPRIPVPAIAITIAFGAVFYQWFLRDILFSAMGLGREILPISEFPYQCHRITGDPNIQACEDMWLDQKSRTLYLACSDSLARRDWMPKLVTTHW